MSWNSVGDKSWSCWTKNTTVALILTIPKPCVGILAEKSQEITMERRGFSSSQRWVALSLDKATEPEGIPDCVDCSYDPTEESWHKRDHSSIHYFLWSAQLAPEQCGGKVLIPVRLNQDYPLRQGGTCPCSHIALNWIWVQVLPLLLFYWTFLESSLTSEPQIPSLDSGANSISHHFSGVRDDFRKR